MLKNEKIAFVRSSLSANSYECDIIQMRYLDSYFTKPLDSKALDICFLRNSRKSFLKRKVVKRSNFLCKNVCIPYDEGLVIYPMLQNM